MLRAHLAVTALVLCAGCAQTSSTESPSSASESTSPTSSAPSPTAKGPRIRGTGYVYSVPKGWGPLPEKLPGFDPDSVAFDLRDDRDRFMDNVNVLRTPQATSTYDEIEESARAGLESVGIKNVSVKDRVEVAGEEAVHLTAEASTNGLPYRVDQFYLQEDGQAIVVTFSFSMDVASPRRAEVTDAVMASWTWTD